MLNYSASSLAPSNPCAGGRLQGSGRSSCPRGTCRRRGAPLACSRAGAGVQGCRGAEVQGCSGAGRQGGREAGRLRQGRAAGILTWTLQTCSDLASRGLEVSYKSSPIDVTSIASDSSANDSRCTSSADFGTGARKLADCRSELVRQVHRHKNCTAIYKSDRTNRPQQICSSSLKNLIINLIADVITREQIKRSSSRQQSNSSPCTRAKSREGNPQISSGTTEFRGHDHII